MRLLGRTSAGRCAAAATATAVIAFSAPADAADDGAFGRLDGDLHLELGAGADFGAGGPSLGIGLGALYLGTGGIYAHYTDALGSDAPLVERGVAVGALLRPLFLGRYAKDLEQGPPRLDLFVDSLTFGVGAVWDDRRATEADGDPGLEISLSVAAPIFDDATGPFIGLRGALRWRATDLAGRGHGDVIDRGALLTVSLAWHHVVGLHVVDAGDRAVR